MRDFMPANLTLQYLEAEEVFRNAKTANEKIAALEDMLASIPKHKAYILGCAGICGIMLQLIIGESPRESDYQ
jgi:hypothetical protein